MAGEFSFSGIGSGIDGRALAQAVADRYRLPNVKYQSQVSDNSAENKSLANLRELLLKLSESLDALRTANGGAGVLEASSSNDDAVGVSVGAGAQIGNFLVNVQTLATLATGSFQRSFGAADEKILAPGSAPEELTVTVGTGDDAESFNVSVDETTTASEFVTRFNQGAQGRAYAAVVNLGSDAAPDYRITFTSQTAGTAEGSLDFSDNGGALGAAVGDVYLEQATDAVFTVGGVSGTFTRSSNTVTDAVQGVSFELKNTGASLVSVRGSSTGGARQVESFVKAFNDLARFVAQEDRVEQRIEDGERVNDFGSLARGDVDDQVVRAVRSALAEARSSDGSTSLASLGVSTNRDGTLSFDAKKFEATFNANPAAANEAVSGLADKISGVSGVVYQYTAYGLAIDQAIQANELDSERLASTIDNIDRRAAAKEQVVMNQFSRLEGLYAQLQQNAGFVTSLLKF